MKAWSINDIRATSAAEAASQCVFRENVAGTQRSADTCPLHSQCPRQLVHGCASQFIAHSDAMYQVYLAVRDMSHISTKPKPGIGISVWRKHSAHRVIGILCFSPVGIACHRVGASHRRLSVWLCTEVAVNIMVPVWQKQRQRKLINSNYWSTPPSPKWTSPINSGPPFTTQICFTSLAKKPWSVCSADRPPWIQMATSVFAHEHKWSAAQGGYRQDRNISEADPIMVRHLIICQQSIRGTWHMSLAGHCMADAPRGDVTCCVCNHGMQ